MQPRRAAWLVPLMSACKASVCGCLPAGGQATGSGYEPWETRILNKLSISVPGTYAFYAQLVSNQ